MAVNSETEINLKTLQRVDSSIVEIIDNASQVAIYKYERKLNKWEGTDIEGTLFLYRRSLYPFHGFIIVNRMSTTNFVEVITSDMEFLLQEPYFLYKKSCGEIIGSWFYEEKDFRRITNRIQSIVLKQTSPPRRQRSSSDSDSQLKEDDAVQHIMSMLFEAHSQCVKTDVSEIVSEKNIEEDFNDLTTYTDKKLSNKSLDACTKKFKENSCMRSSSEEKHLASPRRRFLSTGSCDSTRSSVSSRNILNHLVSYSKAVVRSDIDNVWQAKDNSQSSDNIQFFPLSADNAEDLPASVKLSSLFSLSEVVTPTLTGVSILDHSIEPVEALLRNHTSNTAISNVTKKTSSSTYKPNWKNSLNNKNEYDVHTSELKETLISHLEWDSNIMLKIHEAYIASLKSLFTQKKT